MNDRKHFSTWYSTGELERGPTFSTQAQTSVILASSTRPFSRETVATPVLGEHPSPFNRIHSISAFVPEHSVRGEGHCEVFEFTSFLVRSVGSLPFGYRKMELASNHRAPSAALAVLPDDVLVDRMLPHLGQGDVAALGSTSRRMFHVTSATLRRSFRCATCHVSLFQPRDLVDVRSSWRLIDAQPRHADALPRRSFMELQARFMPRIYVDRRPGKANFLAVRHLRQIGETDIERTANIDILRCKCCGVYVGFRTFAHVPPSDNHVDDLGKRHGSTGGLLVNESQLLCSFAQDCSLAGEKLCNLQTVHASARSSVDSRKRLFVGREYVELVNGNGVRVTRNGEAKGDSRSDRSDNEKSTATDVSTWFDVEKSCISDMSGVYCSTTSCGTLLFYREDFLPWSHVLASTRLADMDAYLEWDHAWGSSRPALFVKRMSMSYDVEQPRWVKLRQGIMEIGDVICHNCGRHIGWRFLSELPEMRQGALRNFDQVGRFGVFRDALRL